MRGERREGANETARRGASSLTPLSVELDYPQRLIRQTYASNISRYLYEEKQERKNALFRRIRILMAVEVDHADGTVDLAHDFEDGEDDGMVPS
jgi:hypothetical protein